MKGKYQAFLVESFCLFFFCFIRYWFSFQAPVYKLVFWIIVLSFFLAAVTHTYKQVAQNNPDLPIEPAAEIQSDPKDLIEHGHSSGP